MASAKNYEIDGPGVYSLILTYYLHGEAIKLHGEWSVDETGKIEGRHQGISSSTKVSGKIGEKDITLTDRLAGGAVRYSKLVKTEAEGVRRLVEF